MKIRFKLGVYKRLLLSITASNRNYSALGG
jgi:hypothetical protein